MESARTGPAASVYPAAAAADALMKPRLESGNVFVRPWISEGMFDPVAMIRSFPTLSTLRMGALGNI
jgi:hypothetical protein